MATATSVKDRIHVHAADSGRAAGSAEAFERKHWFCSPVCPRELLLLSFEADPTVASSASSQVALADSQFALKHAKVTGCELSSRHKPDEHTGRGATPSRPGPEGPA